MEELELELETNIWDRPSTSRSNVDAPTQDLPTAAASTATLTDADDDPSTATGMAGKTIDGAIAKELEAAFIAGLNNVSTSKNKVEVQALSKRTGVSTNKIKQWIHNRGRKGKARSSRGTYTCSHSPSAYSGYMRVALKGLSGEERVKKMKECGKEWKKIADDEVMKMRYREMDRRHAKEMQEKMSERQKRNAADKLMHRAKDIVQSFEELGYACAFVATNQERMLEGYTPEIKPSTQEEIGKCLMRDVLSRKEEIPELLDRNSLRRKVSDLLNEKYRQGIPGCRRHTIPFTKKESFEVEGLPEGVELRRVCHYTKKTLIAILQNMPAIKFRAKLIQQGPEEPNMEVDLTHGGQGELDQLAVSQEPIPLADISESDSDDEPLADLKSKKLPSAGKRKLHRSAISQKPIPLADIAESDVDDEPLADLKSKKLPSAGQNSAEQEGTTRRERKKKGKKYYVSRILEKKGDSFRVLWQGYPLASATWEPRENLPRELVQNFEQQM